MARRRGQEAAAEAGRPLSGVRRGAGAVSWSAAGDQGSHFSTTLATLDISTHCTYLIHCLDILTTIYHCIFTMPMLPTTVPVYKCGPVSSARGNFPHCLRSRYPTILTIAVLLLWAAPVSPICRLSCPRQVGTGHRTPLQTTLHPFPCTLTLSAILATIELNL